MILVTGSAGLIGRHLCERLTAAGMAVRGFDIRTRPADDIRDAAALARALPGVTGIVHLAAVSRVLWGERDPAACIATNVDALRGLLHLCRAARPWLILASSREVYGDAAILPVAEDAPLRPVNVYGRTKRDGEAMIAAAREAGLVVNVARFSSVYGCADDHPGRVAMAFATAAARGGTMRIEHGATLLDFTAVEDVADGLFRMVEASIAGERLPPVHFVSGHGTTLRGLAEIARTLARAPVELIEVPGRDFDVAAFVGDPTRAAALLGWRATAGLEVRFARLISDLSGIQSTRSS